MTDYLSKLAGFVFLCVCAFMIGVVMVERFTGDAPVVHDVKVGGAIESKTSRGEDGWLIEADLPKGSKNIFYLGNGWIIFEFNEQCFLYASHGRNSTMATCD